MINEKDLENMHVKNSTITIGLPVYNGEKTIRKALESILAQTFTDFQVVISDNYSTDDTRKICQEYSKKYSNITYFQQTRNKGPLYNFTFVLNYTNSEYFVWLAADDWWEPTFLEKNVSILDSDENFVGSVSKIDYYDRKMKNNQRNTNNLKLRIKKYYSYNEYHKFEKYEERVSFYLRLNRAENVYGLFRTSILKKCINKCLKTESLGMDLKVLLYIQRFGKINLLSEILLHRSANGTGSDPSSKKNLIKYNRLGMFGKIFPLMPYSWWILKDLGSTIFLKNIDYILFINGAATKYQLKQLLKKL